jgi:hypothetical protein
MFIAAPLSAQVPVYTNKPIAKTPPPRHQITPEEYQSLLAHQFVYVPPAEPQRTYAAPVVVQSPLPPPSWQAEPIYIMPFTGWAQRSYGYSYGFGGKPSHRSERPMRREPEVRPRETRPQPTPVSTTPAPRPAARPIGITIRE